MASFYAELELEGSTYPVRHCEFEFSQTTDARGRVNAKVRHDLLHLTLDVPADDALLAWAAAPHKALAGHVTFYETDQQTARETVSFASGQCVGYQESFASGDGPAGAYVCALTITSDGLVLTPGGPGAHARPAPGATGVPHEAYLDPMVVPLLTPAPVAEAVAETTVGAVAETVAEAAVGATLASALGPAALVLALILGSATPAGGPGIPQPHLPPVGRDVLRLRELEFKHANGTLRPGEQAELIALLAKVKGLHVHNLSEIDPTKKPKYAPVIGKWIAKKGRIDVLKNGDWQYTDWEGNAVVYQGDEPNFDKYARQQVDIKDMKGDCTTDFTKADAGAALGAKLPGNIWHHKQNTKTMQEVPRDIHERFTHYGARHVLKNQANLTQINPAPTIGKRVLRKK